MVNINALPAEQKRLLWERIKLKRPALASLYQSEMFKRLVDRFDGSIMLPLEDYENLMGSEDDIER
jgi:hypothetical protein